METKEASVVGKSTRIMHDIWIHIEMIYGQKRRI